ncbi:MAG: serine/threonine-protein phosphatase [Bacteroidetes bacterium]|nr:serine/threonine-protein phosphatase [Bacteroidota bacterium]MCL5738774.1 serine/threonine-protein phosphatase [Bacteroidota bacterium]
MNQRQLFHTIEKTASKDYRSDEELLQNVVQEIISTDQIRIRGGRIWKLIPRKNAYILVKQMGQVKSIADNFTIKVSEYPDSIRIGNQKTVLSSEQNPDLRKRGIENYSATGVGDKTKVKGVPLYQYILAFNSAGDNQELFDTLNVIGSAVTAVLRERHAVARTKQLEQDIDKAREIQRIILPEHEQKYGSFLIFGVSVPERVVGGDFFDYLPAGEEGERLGVAIGDAASKGLSAAVEALYVSGALKMGVELQTNMASLVKKINNLVNWTFSDSRFVTLFYGEFTDGKSGLFLYVNAGHNQPLFFKRSKSEVTQLSTTGPALGIAPNARYQVGNVNFEKGDILLLYTDGISEATDSNFGFFGEERLKNKLIELSDLEPRKICYELLEEVQKFSVSSAYADDKTLVVIKRIA